MNHLVMFMVASGNYVPDNMVGSLHFKIFLNLIMTDVPYMS